MLCRLTVGVHFVNIDTSDSRILRVIVEEIQKIHVCPNVIANRNDPIADLQRGKDAAELGSDTDPELLNDAIFGAIYYRMLLRSGPLTRRFGEELVEQVLRGHRSGNARK